jgi:hypothetical protein
MIIIMLFRRAKKDHFGIKLLHQLSSSCKKNIWDDRNISIHGKTGMHEKKAREAIIQQVRGVYK